MEQEDNTQTTQEPGLYEQSLHIVSSYENESFSIRGVQVLIKQDPNFNIISVRGMGLELLDILRMALVFPRFDKNTGVSHAGMSIAANRIAGEIDKRLDKDKPTYVGGHSMGAGISLLLTSELEDKGFNVIRWLGLGCPRMEMFDVFYKPKAKLFSFVNGKDIVTYVPLAAHPVPTIKIGTPSAWYPNFKDHDRRTYVSELGKLYG